MRHTRRQRHHGQQAASQIADNHRLIPLSFTTTHARDATTVRTNASNGKIWTSIASVAEC
jgi:hypothetical protein